MEFVEGGQVNDRAYMEKNQIDVNEVRWASAEGRGTECVWGCLPRPGALRHGEPGRVLLSVRIQSWVIVAIGTSLSEHQVAAGFFSHNS